MMWILVILLIVIGLALIVVEVLVLPGITVAGVSGIILIAAGVFFSFRFFGNTTGAYTLIGTCLLFIVFLIYAMRVKTWDKLSLHSEIDGKVNVLDVDAKSGDDAVTVSRLAPVGKVMIHGKIVEGKSEFGMIDANKKVEVVQVNESSVVVREANQ
jgi:membrane-bound ClpP family serine protease